MSSDIGRYKPQRAGSKNGNQKKTDIAASGHGSMLQRLKEQFPEGKRNCGWTIREARIGENIQKEVSKD